MEEYLKIYNENNEDIGEVRERKIVHELGLWHREVEIWVINKKGEILLEQRSPSKKMGANKWSLVAGHVEKSETLVEGAIRESEEEVGLKNLSPADLILFNIKKCEYNKDKIKNNCYKYCYILKTDFDIEDFVIQKEEVSDVKYMSINELKKLSDEEKEMFTKSFRESEFKNTLEKLENKLKDLEED